MYCFKVLVIIVAIVWLANQGAAWLCIVLKCWLLLSLLFGKRIRESLLVATDRPESDTLITRELAATIRASNTT